MCEGLAYRATVATLEMGVSGEAPAARRPTCFVVLYFLIKLEL